MDDAGIFRWITSGCLVSTDIGVHSEWQLLIDRLLSKRCDLSSCLVIPPPGAYAILYFFRYPYRLIGGNPGVSLEKSPALRCRSREVDGSSHASTGSKDKQHSLVESVLPRLLG